MQVKSVFDMTEEEFRIQEVLLIEPDSMELFASVGREKYPFVLSIVEDRGVDLNDCFKFEDIQLRSGLRDGQTVITRDKKLAQLKEDGFNHLSFKVFYSLLHCDLVPPPDWRRNRIRFDAIIAEDRHGGHHTPVMFWDVVEYRLSFYMQRIQYDIGTNESVSAVIVSWRS